MYSILLQSINPFLNLCFLRANLVAVDAEAFGDIGTGECLLQVADAGGEAAALVGGEGNDGLAVEVDVAEEGEHHLRVGAPPYGTADEDGVVLR